MPRPLIPERRERILTAARELLLERGWTYTSISDISTRVGIGKGAVYLEFTDKADVLDAVLRRGMRDLTQRIRRLVVEADDVVDLAQIYRFMLEALLDDPLMSAVYLREKHVLGDHVRSIGAERYQERFAWLGEYAMNLQRAGVIDGKVALGDTTRMLSVFSIGLVHASETMEAMTHAQVSSAVRLFADLVGGGLKGGSDVDAVAAREAQLQLLRRLDEQLQDLEDKSSRNGSSQ